MARLVLLGTAAAVADLNHENTYMVLDGERSSILIDCAGSPIGRLQRARVAPHSLSAIIITHSHPDHTYGLPILLMSLWLMGRHDPLNLYAPAAAIVHLQTIMDAYEWNDWPHFYPLNFVKIPMEVGAPVLENDDFTITAAPCDHFVPTIGLRIVNRSSGYCTVYTSDSAPTANLQQLAQGANLLLHESAGATLGHSSAGMAGRLASEAGVGKLVLVHYQVYANHNALIAEARSEFSGPIEVAEDFADYPI
jgi:ribonuclease Z